MLSQGTFTDLSLYSLLVLWVLLITTSGILHQDSVIKGSTLSKTLSVLSFSTDGTPFILKNNLLPHCSTPLIFTLL